MSKLAKALTAAAGNAEGSLGYVEDVFSTYLYTGNGSTQTITNGIDLAGEGGLVWEKNRDGSAYWHHFRDSETGADKMMELPNTSALQNVGAGSFTSTGYTANATYGATISGRNYVSWTFRKTEKFFDIVTYTGDETTNRMINHNLGSTPGFIIVKATNYDGGNPWSVYHRSLGATKGLRLNTTSAAGTDIGYWYNQSPTDTQFGVGTDAATNGIGINYVAYLFAHDAGGFGDDGSESIIKCGSFTGNTTVELGFEPAWIMIKPTNVAGNWDMHDVMRGWPSSGDAKRLKANLAEAETSTSQIYPNATGFSTLIGSDSYIYIAIRRPMKTPESGTEVFKSIARAGTGTSTTITGVGFAPDASIIQVRNAAWGSRFLDRLRNKMNDIYTTGAEQTITNAISSWNMDGVTVATDSATNGSGRTFVDHYFKRATGFFDVVAYDGTGVSPMNVTHNLGVTPELIITKARTGGDTYGWWTYPLFVPDAYGNTGKVKLNDNTAYGSTGWTGPMATSTAITVPSTLFSNKSGEKYVAYLFASLDGISKLGMYTGNGTSQTIDCGFAAGARFILIKRTDSTGDWYVWDSTRGIVAGNDPHLSLNSTAAEVTTDDSIDPASSGFIVNQVSATNINVSSASYIYLSIAQEYQLWNTECNQAAKS